MNMPPKICVANYFTSCQVNTYVIGGVDWLQPAGFNLIGFHLSNRNFANPAMILTSLTTFTIHALDHWLVLLLLLQIARFKTTTLPLRLELGNIGLFGRCSRPLPVSVCLRPPMRADCGCCRLRAHFSLCSFQHSL